MEDGPRLYAVITGWLPGFLVIEPVQAVWRIREFDLGGAERAPRAGPLVISRPEAIAEAYSALGPDLQNFWIIPDDEPDAIAYALGHGQPGVERRLRFEE